MAKSIQSILLILSLASAGFQASAAEKSKNPDYYPLKVGTSWQYKLTTGDQSLSIVNRVAKIEDIDGKAMARVESSVGGAVGSTEHLRIDEKGLFRHRFQGMEISPPICLLRFPVKENDKWEAEVKIGATAVKTICHVFGMEEVTVPAGKYEKALKLDVTAETPQGNLVSTYWFVDGVGIVKQTMDIAGSKMTLELEKTETDDKTK